MEAIRSIFALFKVAFDTTSLQKGNQAINKTKQSLTNLEKVTELVKGSIRSFGVALAGYISVSAFRTMVTDTIRASDQLNTFANRLDMSARTLEAWQYAVMPANVTLNDLMSNFRRLQVGAQGAITGNQELAGAFRSLGISGEQIRPIVNDTNALMLLLSQGMSQTSSSATRMAAVNKILGREVGARMIPVLTQGTEALTAQLQAVLDNNQATEQMTKAADEYSKEEAKMLAALSILKTKFVVEMMPTILEMVRKITALFKWTKTAFDWIVKNSSIWANKWKIIGAAAVTAAAVTIGAWGPVIATWAFWILGIAAVILLLDDLIVTAQGGDSVLKKLIDTTFGMGTTADIIFGLKNLWQDLGGVFEWVGGKLKVVYDFLQHIADFWGGALGLATLSDFDVSTSSGLARGSSTARGEGFRDTIDNFVYNTLGIPRGENRGGAVARRNGFSARMRPQIEAAVNARQAFEFERDFVPNLMDSPVGETTNNVSMYPVTNFTINSTGDTEETWRRIEPRVRGLNNELVRDLENTLAPNEE